MIAPELCQEMTTWRQRVHANPEVGFEEQRTAALIVEVLAQAGFDDIATGVGGTGVVATLRAGMSNCAIGLRADMDALRITEAGDPPYRSETPGVMHACGHDGHVSMLLGAAVHLAETRAFDGTIRFIFQPAEEWGAGMQAMLDDGLLQRFPIDEAYGLHNMPGLPVGEFATATGPLMGAEDLFEITVTGSGGHASRPHETQDALVAACAIVMGLQEIVARRIAPSDLAVVSVTELESDGTRNAIASNAVLRGDCRSFRQDVSKAIEQAMREIATATAAARGCAAEIAYQRIFIPTINDAEVTRHAAAAAARLGATDPSTAPIGASEDFARLLSHVPGNFMFIGNGDSAVLHHAAYDFDDRALAHGAAYWVTLAEARLPL